MKKLHGQMDLVDDNLPVMTDEEVAGKLEQIWKLRAQAKEYDKLVREIKEVIDGWVLGLSKENQAVGEMRCGDFILPFSVEKKDPEHIEYETKGGKKVKLKLAPDKEED